MKPPYLTLPGRRGLKSLLDPISWCRNLGLALCNRLPDESHVIPNQLEIDTDRASTINGYCVMAAIQSGVR
jgi:hypothetical protein